VTIPLAGSDADAPPDPETVGGELRLLWLVEQVRLRRIGVGKAAELAEMPRAAFMEMLGTHRVPVMGYAPTELEVEVGQAPRPREGDPTHRLPKGAFTTEELAVMDGVDPVDPEAALAWMAGKGPDPWPGQSR
jgi:hypothetical protein